LELNEYQKLAARTRGAYDCEKGRAGAALALCGEVGELANLIKKQEYHGHPVEWTKVRDELGDVLWYVAELATLYQFNLSDLAEDNLDKLWDRYGGEFSSEHSIHRK